jgi:hypothetical protein
MNCDGCGNELLVTTENTRKTCHHIQSQSHDAMNPEPYRLSILPQR